MPTLADELREQGIQQGIQQGAIQSTREAVIDNLAVRFEAVPEPIIKAIHEINELALLKILHRKAIKVKSLEEFVEVINLMTS